MVLLDVAEGSKGGNYGAVRVCPKGAMMPRSEVRAWFLLVVG
jgi:hypothetical protein